MPAAVALAAAASLSRPRILDRTTRWLDALLLIAIASAALQLAPLPDSWRAAVSPHAAIVEGVLRFDARTVTRRPISLDPAATARSLGLFAMVLAAFWTARKAFSRGGIRPVVRAVGWAGLVISVLAIAVRHAAPGLLYGLWRPDASGIKPYGPFVNRNHMATWLLLALPLTIGYLVARVARRGSVTAALDASIVWTAGAAGAMFAALVVSLSRSAAIGAAAGATCGALIALARHGRRSRGWLALAVLLGLAIAASMPMSSQLLSRFDNAKGDTNKRLQIWRETVPIVRDFPLTGVGLGAYGMAMVVYQRSDRAFFFNDAHDEYLQWAAEGGLLVGVPLMLAAIAATIGIARRLRNDESAGFWIRAGAVASLTAVAVQSVWETGLEIPANALLFAVVAAVAVHETHPTGRREASAPAPSRRAHRASIGGSSEGDAAQTHESRATAPGLLWCRRPAEAGDARGERARQPASALNSTLRAGGWLKSARIKCRC